MGDTVINSATTGIKSLVYAVMTDENTETYGVVKQGSPLINLKFSPKTDKATLYADNRAVESATVIGDIDVSIETQDMPLEMQADFFGHVIDATKGTLTYNIGDQAPYLAIGYQRTKANGKNRYVWLFKVKFEDIEEEGKTSGDKVEFQTPNVSGSAISNKKGDWKITADEDVKGSVITGFLSVVGGTPIL